MSCTRRRIYLRDPNQRGLVLPTVPTNSASWQSIQTFLVAMKLALESAINKIISDAQKQVYPIPVTGFLATLAPSGILLTWNHSTDASFYTIFRAESPDFTTARLVSSQYADQQKNQFFDVGGQATGTSIYYWIKAWNESGNGSPLAPAVTAVDPGF